MIQLTPKSWKDFCQVQSDVNSKMSYQSDLKTYGQTEWWEPGNTIGDCDDYAMTKRQRLMTAGYPWECLKLTDCSTETKGRHLVLTVRTDKGDFVLDNRYTFVIPWDALPYTWHKIQDHNSPTGWVECK